MEVEHVKAHRTKKEKEKMTKIERLSLKEMRIGKSRSNAGRRTYGRSESCYCEAGEREEVYVALQYAASVHCLVEEWKDCEELRPKPKEKWSFVDKGSERMKHRTEWSAEADWYRCMRFGKGSKYMEMPGKCYGQKFLSKRLGKWRSRHLGGHDLVRRMYRQGEVFIWCRTCSGYARQRMGPKLMDCCRPEHVDTKEFGNMVKRIKILEEGRVPAKEANN